MTCPGPGERCTLAAQCTVWGRGVSRGRGACTPTGATATAARGALCALGPGCAAQTFLSSVVPWVAGMHTQETGVPHVCMKLVFAPLRAREAATADSPVHPKVRTPCTVPPPPLSCTPAACNMYSCMPCRVRPCRAKSSCYVLVLLQSELTTFSWICEFAVSRLQHVQSSLTRTSICTAPSSFRFRNL